MVFGEDRSDEIVFKKDDFIEEFPEQTVGKLFERIKEIIKEQNVHGAGSKTILAENMVKHYQFSIENSANHKNCPSAKEFVKYFKTKLDRFV